MSVVVGASVASVDGVVASVAMARGRAETLVGGARVVAQGGMRGAGEVAQRERASAGERHAEEGAGEEDARARGGGSAGVAAGAAHGPKGRTSAGGERRERARGSEETGRGVPTPTRNPRRTTRVVRNESRARDVDPRVEVDPRVRAMHACDEGVVRPRSCVPEAGARLECPRNTPREYSNPTRPRKRARALALDCDDDRRRCRCSSFRRTRQLFASMPTSPSWLHTSATRGTARSVVRDGRLRARRSGGAHP